ncbi:hypothetical protein OROGR_007448 [Orobanche gracilis]
MDEDGKRINPPHIPQYMASVNAERRLSLKHQRMCKCKYEKVREGACENCRAVTHDKKSCRQKGAKWTGQRIAPYEKIGKLELDYDGKRDQWNVYDTASHERVVQFYEAREEARRKILKLQKLEANNNNENKQGGGVRDDEK